MTADFDGLEIEIVTSRRALIDVIIGLADQSEALTVLGGHAVIEVTQGISELPPDDTTRDGDLGVIPQLLGDAPRLDARMTELGYETARSDRSGVRTAPGCGRRSRSGTAASMTGTASI